MSTNNDYATGNLLNYLYNQRYKLTGIDLPRYANTRIPQQINFTGKLDAVMVQQNVLSLKSNKKLVITFL